MSGMSLLSFIQQQTKRDGIWITIAQFGLSVLVGLSMPGQNLAQQHKSPSELVEQFKTTQVFWQQFEIATSIVELRDLSVLPQLKSWLTDDDRHLREIGRASCRERV